MAIRTDAALPHASAPERSLFPLVAAVLAVWFLIVLGLGAEGAFESAPGHPPLPVLVAILAPVLLFGLAYRALPAVRAYAQGLDLRLVTAMQAWRVLGGMFLALYAFGVLPGAFAWPAGAGDMAVGVAAVVVLRAMLKNAPTWRSQVWWLNVAGIADFVGAVGTGVLTSNPALGLLAGGAAQASLGALPLSLVPTFAVPLWTILHVVAFLQLRRLRRAADDGP